MKKSEIIYFIERNIRGAWVVWGIDGIKQYYGYTKKEAKKKYLEYCNVFVNEPVKQ